MKKLSLLASAFFLISCSAFSQLSQDEAAITSVVNTMFKAMEKGDSAMLHTTFHPSATGATILRDKTGQPVLRRESSMEGFLTAVGTPHKEVWFEDYWNLQIKVDGDFAQAWCDYSFYVDKNFSHCGVDAFQFFKTKGGEWKIIHLADTRRKEPCHIPDEIKQKRTK